MPAIPPADPEQRLPAPAPGTAAGLRHSDNLMKPARVLPVLQFTTKGVDQPPADQRYSTASALPFASRH